MKLHVPTSRSFIAALIVVTILLCAATLVTANSAAMAIWLSAHPQSDNTLWGARASRLVSASILLIVLDVSLAAFTAWCVARRRRERMKGR
jgi:hypothetical protein